MTVHTATKCRKPRMTSHRGRTWDYSDRLTVGLMGHKVTGLLDTSWGQYVYFQYGPENQWFKVTVEVLHDGDRRVRIPGLTS